jgi:hypothetical protein
VETGASVPGYSGGLAACAGVSDPDFCSRGSLTPVAAPNVSLNVFLGRGRRMDAKRWFRIRGLIDVA